MRTCRRFGPVAILALLPACGLLGWSGNEWRFGEPPPPLPVTAYGVEGEIRDFATLAPIPNAEIVLTTGREGYAARARSDASGRFRVAFSALAKEYTSGDAFADALFGTDSSDDLVSAVEIRVTAPGRPPVMIHRRLEGSMTRPLVIYMDRLITDDAIRKISLDRLLVQPR